MASIKDFLPKNSIYSYFIDGMWKHSTSGKVIEITSPIDQSLVGKVQAITQAEATEAIASAHEAFLAWSNETIDKRAQIIVEASKILEENADLFIHFLTWEIGKVYKEAEDEVFRTVSLMQYYAEEGRRIHNEVLYSDAFPGYNNKKIALTRRVPLGVVLGIAPFNYPINEGMPKIVGALICGNTMVFKPSQQGSITSLYMAECFRRAGLPAGVLNVVTGSSSEIGDTLAQDPRIAAINFTGSTRTAKHIRDIMGIIPLVAGLSGKDAAIILEDADMSLAVEEVAKGAFSYAGQRCTAIKRVLVEESLAKSFVSQLQMYVQKHFSLGDPRERATTQGPVISEQTVAYLDELLYDALSKGATLVLGGENKNYQNRKFYPSTLVDHVTEEMRLAWEEQFGPILPIMYIRDADDAIRLTNKSEYGLQASIFTNNINKAFYIAEKLDTGGVQINGKDARGPDHFPFLGTKGSGIGQVQGAKYLIEQMTRIKTIVINKNF